ncbi:unnamed protein product [Pylaiella littoralis]
MEHLSHAESSNFTGMENAQAMASVRLFRTASKVRDAGEKERRTGLLRVWEEIRDEGKSARIPLSAVFDLCEMYTAVQETLAGQHNGDSDQGVRSSSWDRYVAEGFLRTPAKRRRRGGSGGAPLQESDGITFRHKREHLKRQELTDLWDIWGTWEKVLDVLRGLIQAASHLSSAVRAPSHNGPELDNLDLLARDVVTSCRIGPITYPSYSWGNTNLL